MDYRKINNTDIEISSIGLGTWAFGSDGWWGFQDDRKSRDVMAEAVTRGVNAAVVGLLGAALYTLLWSNAMKTTGDFGVALVGFLLLTAWRTPPLMIVILSAFGGMALA